MIVRDFLVKFFQTVDGNDDHYKNFNFSFHYICPSSIALESFITIKRQEKQLSIIKIFKFFVSDPEDFCPSGRYVGVRTFSKMTADGPYTAVITMYS